MCLGAKLASQLSAWRNDIQFQEVQPQSFTTRVHCGLEAHHDDVVEFQEFASNDLRAGYGSIFGDGRIVQIDVCQHCLKQTLSPWLRVGEPRTQEDLASHQLFDPKRYGGKFPSNADKIPVEPEDLPVRERRSLDADLTAPNPPVGQIVVLLNGLEDAHAPPPTSVLRSNDQRWSDAQAVIREIEARNDQGACTNADRCEHSVIKNLCRSIPVHLGAVNELREPLGRHSSRTKRRLANG